MKKKIDPTTKVSKGVNHRLHDRRPLARNKILYNRVIKSIITHKLEECLGSESKLVILSELLSNMVYSRQISSLSSLARIDAMLRLLKKYTNKIIEDCRIFKLVPSAEFEPPEKSLVGASAQEQIIFQLEKRRKDIFQITPEGHEWINLSSDILEQVAKNVFKCKVSKVVNADKYSQVLHWATCWAEDQKEDTKKKFHSKTEKTENYNTNKDETLEDINMSSDFEMTNRVALNSSQTTIEQQSSLVINTSHELSFKSEPHEEIIAHESINENCVSLQEPHEEVVVAASMNQNHLGEQKIIKSPYRTKSMQTSSASRSVVDSSSSNDFNENLANEKMVKLMMLMKKRDLSTREFDQKIYEVLDRYRNSRVGKCQNANPAVI